MFMIYILEQDHTVYKKTELNSDTFFKQLSLFTSTEYTADLRFTKNEVPVLAF